MVRKISRDVVIKRQSDGSYSAATSNYPVRIVIAFGATRSEAFSNFVQALRADWETNPNFYCTTYVKLTPVSTNGRRYKSLPVERFIIEPKDDTTAQPEMFDTESRQTTYTN